VQEYFEKQEHNTNGGKMKRALLNRVALALPLTLAGVFASANAYGETIDLNQVLMNPSFESGNQGSGCPVSWNCGGSPAPGFSSYIVTSAQYTAGSDGLLSGIVPNGAWAATSPTPVEGSGDLNQEVTSLTYVAGDTYTLALWVGTPKTLPNLGESGANTTPVGPVATGILYFDGTGGVQLTTGPTSDLPITIPAVGQWQLENFTFTADATDAGQPIGITIFVNSGGNNLIANFDMVQTPEPGTFALFGSSALLMAGLIRRRRSKR
jgi:hypothetical protein